VRFICIVKHLTNEKKAANFGAVIAGGLYDGE
jgi:hypothetical protein